MPTGDVMSTFAKKVKEIRQAAGLKQAAFAARLGVDQSTVSRWENGRQEPDRAALEQLSKFSGVDLFALFPVSASPGPAPPADVAVKPSAGPLSAEQARVVEVAIRAYLGWMSQHPDYVTGLSNPAVLGAAARIIAQLSRSRRFHEAVARDPDAALALAQVLLDLEREQ